MRKIQYKHTTLKIQLINYTRGKYNTKIQHKNITQKYNTAVQHIFQIIFTTCIQNIIHHAYTTHTIQK